MYVLIPVSKLEWVRVWQDGMILGGELGYLSPVIYFQVGGLRLDLGKVIWHHMMVAQGVVSNKEEIK